ncbi:MAG TPA: methionine--tRNA ligase [Ignavibacteria bacterium]|nr:methionine--tRNA ligase [Ignavibacteria bacterium]
MKNFERLLVTAALPYANGYIHLGHIAGAYLPADIYVRFKRLCKEDIIFICGSDEHGTAIEISAMKEKVTPKEIIDRFHNANKSAFEKLGISFDIYSRTSNEIHHKTSQEFFLNLYKKNLLTTKSEKQLYSEKDKRFLADRFIEGTCPICGYEEARGDQCENCGSNLSPLELKNPKSKISGDTPVVKESVNFYFPLEKFQPELEKWIKTKKDWKANVKNYCEGWFKTGLKDRAITRDLDWGVKIPIEGYEGKVIYVWFEAPIGYISATKELFEQKGTPDKWETYWKDGKTKLVHFIGKDNIIFHAIVFPAMIMAHGDYILAENVPANEFLNLDGGKLSKSKGHGILVKDVVDAYNPDVIRYAIAANLPENKDADFSWEDLQNKNNNELAAILGNFINRTVVFAQNKFGNKIPEHKGKVRPEVFKYIENQKKVIEDCLNNYRFRDALNEIMNIGRAANKYFNDSEPWKVIKDDAEKCGGIINDCLEICHSLAIAINPVLPFTSEKILGVLNAGKSNLAWDNIGKPCLKPGTELGGNAILFPQIELSAAKEEEAKEEDNLITIDDFKKVQLRTAVVLKAEKVEKSKKLLKLQVRCGGKEKQIVAGIAEHYAPEDMLNRKIVIVDNLKPAKLMGLESQGMLLAAKIDGKLKLVGIDGDLPDGADVS